MSSVIESIPEREAGVPTAMPGAQTCSPLTVLDLIMLLWDRWRFIAKSAAAGAVVGLALAFLLPVRYTAVTTILPPSPSSSVASAFAAQSGELGLLAGLAGGSFGFHSPAELCMLMLRSRTVEDAVIQRFRLMQEYDKKRISDTRTALERRTSVTLNLKSGVIAITAQDHDAARAAELANGYVDELRKFTASMAITEASQRRLFFEQQLRDARGSLTEAEEALKTTQQSTGMLDPAGASKASLESAVAVRAQIAARQVQLRTMRTYETEENPAVVLVRQQIAALEAQLGELTGRTEDSVGDPLVPKGSLPAAGAEYLRRLRDLKYNESIVAILARQLEIARLDEARQGSGVQILDLAVTPDKRSFPKRTVTLLASTTIAIAFASLWLVYVRSEPRLWKHRNFGNAALLLLILIASNFSVSGAQEIQTPQSSTQSVGCSVASDPLQEIPCTDEEQNSVGLAPRSTNFENRTFDRRREQPLDRETEGSGDSQADRKESELQRRLPARPPVPHTEFEQMAADSAGRPLAVFGHEMFEHPPESFAPAGNVQVPNDYIVGPGDELRIRIWGQVDADLRNEVDRSGRIYIPQVGEVPVTGVRYGELEGYLKHAVERVYKNFNLAVAIGRLHSIQIFVVGQAQTPGVYTISSLSTLVNAVFASGGPLPTGSLRHIQLRRGDRTVQEFDLYELLIKGDKSHDLALQSGDVVFIPPVGPLSAIAGSVNSPAIYELKEGETLGALIEAAGGLSTLADGSSVTIERVREHQARTVVQFPLDATGLSFALRGGDIIHVSSVVPRFDDTVTLRGYVSNPGRFPFLPGMHVRDLLPDAKALMPREYWLNRAGITDARQNEYPVRKQVPVAPRNPRPADLEAESGGARDQTQMSPQQQQSPNQQPRTAGKSQSREQTIPEYYSELADSETISDPELDRLSRQANQSENKSDMLARDLRKLVPSINWRYALIQRVDPGTLQSQLISFDLGKAVIDGDAANNLALEPGDILTVFSQQDITAPEEAQTRYVKIEGEIEHPGVYELGEGQTLRDVLQLAGGLTAKAYPYGARLTRESARIEQQRGLDEMVRTAQAELRASTASTLASSSQDSGAVTAGQAAQQSLLAGLRSIRASGRVVLAMSPDANGAADFPLIAMEDGDRIVIPARSNTVTVSGAVYNPATFVYDARRRVGDYLQLAGRGALNANQRHAFVLRADGTVISRQEVGSLFHGGFDQLPMHPGDQIVVPEKVDNGVVRALRDWGQIISPLALTTLAISSVIH